MLQPTCSATQLIAALQRLVAEHGDLPVYADDSDTDTRLPIELMHKPVSAVDEWPERFEIKTNYYGRPNGDLTPNV